MSSTNKTTNLQLNNWIGSDVPKREDFNRDNSIIDNAIGEHHADTYIHTNLSEKNIWNTPHYIATYLGNGEATRTITMGCDFSPSWGIVYAVNMPNGLTDFTNKAHYNYVAFVSKKGSMSGAAVSGKNLKVFQSSTAVMNTEYRSFNETGVTYVYIMFR